MLLQSLRMSYRCPSWPYTSPTFLLRQLIDGSKLLAEGTWLLVGPQMLLSWRPPLSDAWMGSYTILADVVCLNLWAWQTRTSMMTKLMNPGAIISPANTSSTYRKCSRYIVLYYRNEGIVSTIYCKSGTIYECGRKQEC